MSLLLVAVPYDFNLNAVYFSDLETFKTKTKEAANEFGDYECELQLIEGSDAAYDLFNALNTDVCNLESFFEKLEEFEELSEEQLAAFNFLQSHAGYDVDVALEKIGDINLIGREELEGHLQEYVAGCLGLDVYTCQHVAYFDTEAARRDLECGGDLVEHGDYFITNASSL